MGNIDKAAIGWSIAIVAIGVGIAAMGGSLQGSLPDVTAPTIPAPSLSGGMADDKISAAKEQIAREQAEKEKAMMEPKPAAEPKPAPVAEPKPAPVAEPKPAPVAEPKPAPVAEPKPAAAPKTVTVSMPAGTSVPGCETTNECYIPATVSIKVGDTVNWTNDDTAAHTVTSGTPTTGPDGNFDSSLVMGKGAFSHKFDTAGSYDYFCMVHPWMKGVVSVS